MHIFFEKKIKKYNKMHGSKFVNNVFKETYILKTYKFNTLFHIYKSYLFLLNSK